VELNFNVEVVPQTAGTQGELSGIFLCFLQWEGK
jgi:hypothetical protein